MNLADNKHKRMVSIIIITVSLIAIVFFLLRGPYLSNTIKRIIVPVLENATGERIIIDSAVINLFPFYFQAKGLKVFDKNGNRLLWVTKTRVYIDLLGLLTREFRVRRMTLKEPELTASKEELEKIRFNVKRYLSTGEGGRFRLSIKSIKMTEGNFALSESLGVSKLSGDGLFADIVVRNRINLRISLKEGVIQVKDRPELRYNFNGRLVVGKNGRVDFSDLRILSTGSLLEADGMLILSSDGRIKGGRLNGKAKIMEETINNFFGINDKRGGELFFSGSVDLLSSDGSKWPGLSLDLDTSGWFYLESLMRILEVEENVTGRLSVDGRISGVYPDLTGSGSGSLEKAVFGNLLLDDVTGGIEYKKKRFTLNDFVAHTFHGELRGNAFIKIPQGDYKVVASFEDVGSQGFFGFVNWDAPFKKGVISGDFNLERKNGQDMHVVAGINYINTSRSDAGLFERIEGFKGNIDFDGSAVLIRDVVFHTPASRLLMDGIVDLDNNTLSLELALNSKDSSDLTAPSITYLKAPVEFTGVASGPYSDPEISGLLEIGSGSIKGFYFSNASAVLKYKINSLSTELLKISHDDSAYEISGSILFRKASTIFSYDDPFYNAEISIKDGNAGILLKAFYRELPLSGDVSGEILLKGDSDGLEGKGELVINNGVVYGQEFDKIIADIAFEPDKINLKSLLAYREDSYLELEGFLSFDESFRLSALSSSVNLDDINFLGNYPVDALLSLELNGSGTVKDPHMELSLNILESGFRGVQTGKGEIKGTLDNRELYVKGSFLDGIVSAESSVTLSDTILWSLALDFKKGKYDPVFAALLKTGQEDISASIAGNVKLSGIGKDVKMRSKFTSALFSLYGYNLRNIDDIILELDDREFHVKSFSLAGDDGDVTVSGSLNIGKDFDLEMEGNLDVVPLRALYPVITSLKGRGKFVVGVIGPWKAPNLTGLIDLEETTATMDVFPYRIGPLNGSLFLKGDRFTFESVKTGFAGGIVKMSGVGYIKQLSLKRLFVSSSIEGIKIRPADGVRATIDGSLFYEISSRGSSLTGDVNIKKARYDKRFEWKSWLLGLKETRKGSMEQSSFYGDTELNIRLTGTENITIDNNITSAPVELDLTVTGTVNRYGLVGKVEAKRGKIYFRSNEFEILDGRLDFVDPNIILPVFHIQAETSARGYRIKLNLDGSVDKFIMSLYSDPPLSDTDILTLLTSGQVNKEESGFESGIAAGEATAILTGGLQDVIEEEVKQFTGFERFEIDPQTTVTGAVSPRVTIGKRLLGDKLFVVYSTSIGTTEENIIKLEYDLARNLSIVGSRDEIDSIGLDLKYRFEFN